MSTIQKTAQRTTVLEPEPQTNYPTAIVRQREGNSIPAPELDALKQALVQEQRAVVIQKASAEKARRSTSCLQAFARTLLQSLNQPCFQINREGKVVLWNTGMILWTDIGDQEAIGKEITQLLPTFLSTPLLNTIREASTQAEALTHAEEITPTHETLSNDDDFESVAYTAIPLLKVPGCVEGCVILLDIV